VIFASPPFCTGYAYYASHYARARIAARVGLVLAGLELLALVALIIIGLLDAPTD
jgi:hypothetical protein